MVTVPGTAGSYGQVREGGPSGYRGSVIAQYWCSLCQRGLTNRLSNQVSHKVGLLMPVLQVIKL